MLTKTKAEEKFHSLIVKSAGCWAWLGTRAHHKYGKMRFNGKEIYAHRLSWYFHHGEWPKNSIDHVCKNTSCVNPAHLEDVPQRINVLRGDSSKNYWANVCGKGHTLNEDAAWLDGKLKRHCRECAGLWGKRTKRYKPRAASALQKERWAEWKKRRAEAERHLND